MRISTVFMLVAAFAMAGCHGPDRRKEIEDLQRRSTQAMAETDGAESPSPPIETAESRARPAWVDTGSSSLFPLNRYIVGIGAAHRFAQDPEAALIVADERARGDIAKAIRVRVTAEFQTAAELVTRVRNDETPDELSTTAVKDRIISVTDIAIEGARIADRWFDSETKTLWSLAALDRSIAGKNILDRMSHLREKIAQDSRLAADYKNAGQPFLAASYYNAATNEALAILNYRGQLTVIDPMLIDTAPFVATAEASLLLRESALARENLRVAVVVFAEAEKADAQPDVLQAALERGLRELGLNIVRVSAGEKADYDSLSAMDMPALREKFGGSCDVLILAQLKARQVAVEQLVRTPIYFYEASADAVIYDLAAGRAVSTAGFGLLPESHIGLPSSARAAEAALLKADNQLGLLLEKELRASLNITQ